MGKKKNTSLTVTEAQLKIMAAVNYSSKLDIPSVTENHDEHKIYLKAWKLLVFRANMADEYRKLMEILKFGKEKGLSDEV